MNQAWLFLLLPAVVIASSSGYGDNVWHVRLVDRWGQNMLFRGGSPEVPERNYNDTAPFNWTALVNAMSSRAALPPTYRLLMVNLESLEYDKASMDGGHVVRELEFFSKNPDKGQLVFWRIVGADNPYVRVLDGSHVWLAKNFDQWDSDQLNARVDLLHSWLHTATPGIRVHFSPPTPRLY